MAKKTLAFRRKKFTELTDSQWQSIENVVDPDKRKRKNSLRQVLNAVLKITSTGMQWRELDEKYPPWQSVFYYFRKWQKSGTIRLVLRHLREKVRAQLGRDAEPSAVAVDSQSVKKGPLVSQDTGIDGGKLINGRKRHLAVDTIGLPVAVHVTAANVNDGTAGLDLLWQMDEESKRLSLVRADHAYQGEFQRAAAYYRYTVEITQKPETQKGFVPQKGRWQVERSFAWLNFFRRLDKDHEKTIQSAIAFNQLAFIAVIFANLAP